MGNVALSNSIVINRPIREVFDTATCMESCINWWTMVKEAKKVSDGPTSVGTEYRHIAKFMGISVESRPVVTKLDPPYLFAYRSGTPSSMMDVEFTFEEVEGGTKMTVSMDAEPNANVVSQIVLPLIVNGANRQFLNDMQGLKDMMESGVKVRLWD